MHDNVTLALDLLERRLTSEPNTARLPAGFFIDPAWYDRLIGEHLFDVRFVTLIFDGDVASEALPCTRVTLHETLPRLISGDAVVICLPTLSAIEWVNSLSQLEALMVRVDRPGNLAICSVCAIGLRVISEERSFFRTLKRYCTTQKFASTCLDMDEDLLTWLKFPRKK